MTSIKVVRQIMDPHQGSMIEIVASRDQTAGSSRFFSLGNLNKTPIAVHQWLGELGIAMVPATKQALQHAIQNLPPPVAGIVATSPGWWGDCFVLPTASFGAGRVNVVNALRAEDIDRWQAKGELSDWQSKIATKLATSPVGVFCLCLSLAGPLLSFSSFSSISCMIVGPPALGKTSMLRIAGSVWGGGGQRDFIESFSMSPREFESAAMRNRDTLLALDETRLLDPDETAAAKQFSQLIFGFASPLPRRVYERPASPEALRGARLFSSNLGGAEIMRRGKRRFEGQDAVRLLELPIDAVDFPVFRFDSLSVQDRGKLVDRLARRSRKYCGEAGKAFVASLVNDYDSNSEKARRRIDRYIREGMACLNLPSSATEVEQRLAQQVAIVYAAGRLGCKYGVLPYDKPLLEGAMVECWNRIHENALRSIGRDPVQEFKKNLVEARGQLFDLKKGSPTTTRAEAMRAAGFIKRKDDGRSEVMLTKEACERLTSIREPVLHWLESRGFLKRDGRKRQVKAVVARDLKGKPIRLRVYKIVCDLDQLQDPAMQASTSTVSLRKS